MANIIHNLTIDAPMGKVYDAIVTEKGLSGWWTNKVIAKAEIGHINSFEFSHPNFNKMKILELNPSNKIVWECIDGDKEWIGTTINFEIKKRNDLTLLKFSHLNWTEESEFFGFCSHHWGRFMDSLKSLCETGTGNPYME